VNSTTRRTRLAELRPPGMEGAERTNTHSPKREQIPPVKPCGFSDGTQKTQPLKDGELPIFHVVGKL
jgi:hypothetical protein